MILLVLLYLPPNSYFYSRIKINIYFCFLFCYFSQTFGGVISQLTPSPCVRPWLSYFSNMSLQIHNRPRPTWARSGENYSSTGNARPGPLLATGLRGKNLSPGRILYIHTYRSQKYEVNQVQISQCEFLWLKQANLMCKNNVKLVK